MNERDILFQAMERQVARMKRRLTDLADISRRYSWLRLGIVLVGVIAISLAFSADSDLLGWLLILVSIAAFLVTAHFHSRLELGVRRYRTWMRIKEGHLARMKFSWENLPTVEPTDPEAPFATDLNLTGERSLHRLIDTAVSRGGSRRLRDWLTDTFPNPARTIQRQELVRELRDHSIFRDRLILSGALLSSYPDGRWEGKRLLTWLQQEPVQEKSLIPYLIGLALLGPLNVVLVLLFVAGTVPLIWPYTFLLYTILYLSQRKSFESLFDDAIDLELQLRGLRGVVLFLESYRYRSGSKLAEFCALFYTGKRRPSTQMKGVAQVALAAAPQKNPLLRLIFNIALPWDLFFAHRLRSIRNRLQQDLPVWIDRWYELEALSALAAFAYRNPDHVFPELLPTARPETGPVLEVERIGHPLLPPDRRVCNDFTLNHTGELVIVTGSNMSGKSTFLRTLGVNLVLAYAGGSVCASSFRVIPFRLFTCINVSDSVNDGISYFYAEVRRLKGLLEALAVEQEFPLFFLIDEIFRGTNNRERLIGSRSYVRALIGGKGAGIISTHDLELVNLADESRNIRNFHFREEVRQGRMIFDYRLRQGPCPTTNALKIMQMEGLPVDEEIG